MQSSSQIVTTNGQYFTRRMPFLLPNHSVRALKEKYHIPWTCLPQAHLGVFQFCLCSSQITTTNKPTPSFFTRRMPFLMPNQQCQSTEGKHLTRLVGKYGVVKHNVSVFSNIGNEGKSMECDIFAFSALTLLVG